ncbi:MAG: VCBS repeat-containing protein [Planctomycetes bacterium]|nr:VCBS repeat-containing protein [Planctomycetota bacterium]
MPHLLVTAGYRDIFFNHGNRLIGTRWFDDSKYLSFSDSYWPNAVFGDVNGDGKLDLIKDQGIYLGHGDGKFGIMTVAFSRGAHFASGDINKDGFRDLFVLGGRSPEVLLFWGKADGTLTPQGGVVPFVQGAEYDIGLTVVDLDGDGEEDLFGGGPGKNLIAFGEGGRKFQKVDVPDFFHAGNARVADLNGDGFKDIVTVGNFRNPEDGELYLTIHVYRCLGHGRFDKALVLPVVKYQVVDGAVSHPDGVAVGDFDRDGHLDLIAGSWPRRLAVFLGRGDGSFEEKFDYELPIPPNPLGDNPTAVLLHDFDLDGLQDLVIGYRANPTSINWGLPEGGYDFENPLLLGIGLVTRPGSRSRPVSIGPSSAATPIAMGRWSSPMPSPCWSSSSWGGR